jgi:hypothetical protein
MNWLLDALAVAAVVLALGFLLRSRERRSCASCPPALGGAETRVPLSALRAAARRRTGRE